jgi:CTP synthase
MRLGSYPATLTKGSVVAEAYGSTEITERHRHRYEVNNAYRDRIAESGLQFSGTSPDGHLVEFVEYPREQHPFFVATQAHPEYKSRPTRPHPLFVAFIKAALDYENEMRLPVEPWRTGQSGDSGPETVDAPDAKTSSVRADEVDTEAASDTRADGS